MPYINLKPGQKVTVTIHGYLDEVLHHGVKVSFGSGYQIELFTETDDVVIAVDDTPEHWPPLAGDVWRLTELDQDDPGVTHASPWAAHHTLDGVSMAAMLDQASSWCSPEELREHGRLELAYREGGRP